MDIALNETK